MHYMCIPKNASKLFVLPLLMLAKPWYWFLVTVGGGKCFGSLDSAVAGSHCLPFGDSSILMALAQRFASVSIAARG